MRPFEQIADIHCIRGQPHCPYRPFWELVVNRNEAAPDVDGFQMNKLVRFIQITHYLRHARQQAPRNVGEVHPAQLDKGRVLLEVVDVHVVEFRPKYAVPVDRKLVALRQDERDGKDRQEAVLHPERRLLPLVEQFGDGNRAIGVLLYVVDRPLPQRGQAAGIVGHLLSVKRIASSCHAANIVPSLPIWTRTDRARPEIPRCRGAARPRS